MYSIKRQKGKIFISLWYVFHLQNNEFFSFIIFNNLTDISPINIIKLVCIVKIWLLEQEFGKWYSGIQKFATGIALHNYFIDLYYSLISVSVFHTFVPV